MAEIKEITAMCRDGRLNEAYTMAKDGVEVAPNDPWQQRALGWALYYMLKVDAESGNYKILLEHLDELVSLSLLTVENDSMIFDNVQLQIAAFVKNSLFLTDVAVHSKLSALFDRLRGYAFRASKGHSYLLQSCIKFENWPEMADFLEWWDLDNLTAEDYTPYVNQRGQSVMTLAERAFIANSKALLRLNDAARIEEFLPRLETLVTQHEEMMYPGYFYGKLLLALGSDGEEALRVIVPFARKKATEFWVWQLLSDVFADDDKRLACLLRAVHCNTQESFLGKVRIKLANLYINKGEYNRARYHIDSVVRCYASQGWRLPDEIDCWIHQPWLERTTPDSNEPLDYKAITDEILCDGAEEAFAVVTYVDRNSHKSTFIYGNEKRVTQKLRMKVRAGDILKLHYVMEKDSRCKVLVATKVNRLPDNLGYAKFVEGTIEKRNDRDFAFLKAGSFRCFVSTVLVREHNLTNGSVVKSMVVYDFDKNRKAWNWVCVTVKKIV